MPGVRQPPANVRTRPGRHGLADAPSGGGQLDASASCTTATGHTTGMVQKRACQMKASSFPEVDCNRNAGAFSASRFQALTCCVYPSAVSERGWSSGARAIRDRSREWQLSRATVK